MRSFGVSEFDAFRSDVSGEGIIWFAKDKADLVSEGY